MPQDTLRIGLIGAGGNTRSRHIPGFREQEGVEIVSVANRTHASGQAVADEFGIPTVHDDWRSLLADPSIDAVCIGTWPYMHKTLTIAALEAGKHVLCEARMAMDFAEAKDMLAAARKRPDLVAQIVPAPHTLTFDRTIQDMVAEGYIGDLIALDARIAAARTYPEPSAPVHWRHDRALSGNNVMNMG
ncbi:MAG TPA: Gfo/Idh/MocA family oxidoreductase, partial [Alphaproteobacteria bacterium]|nr:Gfo/Idh/MocA family oxidoreductase [Alphaproteobacteria bacterium]